MWFGIQKDKTYNFHTAITLDQNTLTVHFTDNARPILIHQSSQFEPGQFLKLDSADGKFWLTATIATPDTEIYEYRPKHLQNCKHALVVKGLEALPDKLYQRETDSMTLEEKLHARLSNLFLLGYEYKPEIIYNGVTKDRMGYYIPAEGVGNILDQLNQEKPHLDKKLNKIRQLITDKKLFIAVIETNKIKKAQNTQPEHTASTSESGFTGLYGGGQNRLTGATSPSLTPD
ncbi:MAG: hypothetical protein KTR28_02745 [Micavibrio sp.]|nr:hypothetical protein [Micavibrio sp.]